MMQQPRRAGRRPRRGLHLRRRHLYVAQLRSPLLRAHLCRPRTRPRARRHANSASRSTGSSTPSATSPSKKPTASSARPPNCAPTTPPSSASASAATSAAPAPSPSAHLYARARAAGLRLTNHAGETTGPEAIWEALAIGSERIGHALSAIHDRASPPGAKSTEHAARAQPHLQRPHRRLPLLRRPSLAPLLRRGLLVTLNSDDPAFFGSDLANEFLLAHTQQGFTRDELRQLAANSILASFLPESEKAPWLAQINTFA